MLEVSAVGEMPLGTLGCTAGATSVTSTHEKTDGLFRELTARMHPAHRPQFSPSRPKIPYLIGLCGFFGLPGTPPFNLLAWFLAHHDIKAPGFEQMPWHYRKRVRTARVLGIVGTLIMLLFWGPVLTVVMITGLLGLR
jgi:hypothetical protein